MVSFEFEKNPFTFDIHRVLGKSVLKDPKFLGGSLGPAEENEIYVTTKLGKMCLVKIPMGHDSGGRCDQFLAKTWF